MKKTLAILLTACLTTLCLTLTACTKPEPPNQECDILSAWVEGSEWAADFYQRSQMRIEEIPSNTSDITFMVRSTSARRMPVHFTLSQGATITPANGSVQDFSAGAVTYTVTSEDGAYSRRYTVAMRTPPNPINTYSFEHVDSVTLQNTTFHTFFDIDANGDTIRIWDSGNKGSATILGGQGPEAYPTRSIAEGYSGKGVCLTTLSAGSFGQLMHKPIAAGNLFIGEFDVNYVFDDPLESTVFGTPVNLAPTSIRGYYKYTPGATFTDAAGATVEGRTDEANIYAIFFRNEDENGNTVKITGKNDKTSPYIVRRAQVTSMPPTTEWAPFELTFDDGAVDPQALANYGYSISIVFSSSKTGGTFEGAVGSTLIVDEVQVTYEN